MSSGPDQKMTIGAKTAERESSMVLLRIQRMMP